VAPPIDLVVYEADAFRVALHQRVGDNDPYFNALCRHWGEGLRRVFAEAPDPPWKFDEEPEPAKLRQA
jgi:putative proteasome-type protease